MTKDATDPGEVTLIGENPFMLLYGDDESTPVASASAWTVMLSPAGPGHVLFLSGEAVGGSCAYTDNIALCRYLQEEIVGGNPSPFKFAADPVLLVHDATFERDGDARSFHRERARSADGDVTLTWYDFLPAFVGSTAPALDVGGTHGHYATYVPSRRVQLVVDGRTIDGRPLPRRKGDREMMSCGLAWCETWVKHRS
jgi:hypothetical protein